MQIQTIESSQQIVEYIHGQTVQRTLNVQEKSELKALFVIDNAEVVLDIHAKGQEAKAEVICLILSKEKQHISVKVNGKLQADNTSINIHLISFLGDQADAHVDGGVTIVPNIKQASGHLLEENIVLGKKVKVKTLPMLDVHSADVSASHGARIDKLDEAKLFYMMAKGLDKKSSQKLIVEGYLQRACDEAGIGPESDERSKVISTVSDYLGMGDL